MKNIVVRSILIALILTGTIALLVWYFTMRREVPTHARVIPKDAFAVLTLNLRELALDRSGEEHLFPEMTDEALLHDELAPFSKAIAANGATGFEETADVLMFAYHSGEAAFFGIAIQLEDSATFGNLIRVHVSREFNIVPWTNAGIPIVRFDTTAACIGWTEDVALFLYPISHHGIATVSTQCIELLKQKIEHSVLADETFKEHELTSFDVALFVNTTSLKNFTGKGDLLEQTLSDVNYFNYFANFEDGEILVRSEWSLREGATAIGMKEIPFPCEHQDVLGFIRFYLDPTKDSLIENYVDSPPFNVLPLNDEEAATLFPYLDGNCMMILHDTIGYETEVVSYEYDENFNRSEFRTTQRHSSVASSSTFRVKDAAKVRDLLTEWMARDSVPLTARGWIFKESGMEARMILTDELLTVTTLPTADGRSHQVPALLKNFMFYFDLEKLFRSKDFSIPFINTGEAFAILEKHVLKLSSTIPVRVGNTNRSEIHLAFVNTKINGLVQGEDLVRRIYTLGK